MIELVEIITALLVVVLIVLLIVYSFPLAVVDGDSMYPTFKNGDILLCRRVFMSKRRHYSPGEILVFEAPYEDEKYLVIKRVSFFVEQKGTKYLYFLGDNPNKSYDSRMYGLLDSKVVVATVLFRIKRCKNG